MPKPPRTEVFPLWKGSQAKPTRGSKFLSVGFLPYIFLLQVLQVWVVGLVVRSGRLATLPCFSVGMVIGSWRSPRFTVRLGRSFQSSWRYTAGIEVKS